MERRARGLSGPTSIRENLALTRRLLAEPTPVLDECVERYGPTFALGVGPLQIVIVGDVHDMDTVLAQPNDTYRWGHFLNLLGFIVGPTSMIVSDGEDHRRRRHAVLPALARRQIDQDASPVDDIGPDHLRRLTHAGAVVHESLRLHPAGLLSPRQAVADIAIGDRTIKKGAMVMWSPYISGRQVSRQLEAL